MQSFLLKYTHLSNADVRYIILLGSFFPPVLLLYDKWVNRQTKAWDIFKLLLETVIPGDLSVFSFCIMEPSSNFVLCAYAVFPVYWFNTGEVNESDSGNYGASAHSDYGALTLLVTDGTPGLQV